MGLCDGVGVELSTQEILDAQAHVWNYMFSHINSMSLKCVVELGIPDVIHNHGKPMTLSAPVKALPINQAKSKSNGLGRLMRLLAHSKFFEKDEEEAYCLTPASRLLMRDGPMSLAPFVLGALDPVMVEPFNHLTEWFKNGDATPFVTKNGKNVWEFTGNDPKWNHLYHETMASDARLVSDILVKEYKSVFEGLKTVVDAGGGTGATAKAIVEAFPGLKCIVVDLPNVVEGLEGSENLSFVGGDMFEYIPPADAVILKWNLSMWTHEEGVKLLKKCKEAIIPNGGGKVIIVEMIVGDQKDKKNDDATETQFQFDLHIMSRFEGVGERTEKEWVKLFVDAGFTNYKISRVLGLRSVIEVFP